MKMNENGRSMIEMLGVLAIIGVLSVGGIYGYTVAMRKYKANEIAQTLSMLATLAHAANAGRGAEVTLANSGLEQTPGGETLTGTTAKCAKADGTVVADANVATDGCSMVRVTLGTVTGDLKNAVCSIVPTAVSANPTTSPGAAERAGYYLTGCTS